LTSFTGILTPRVWGARDRALSLYLVGLASCAVALLGVLLLAGERVEQAWLVVLLAAASAMAERETVRINRTVEMSVALLPSLFAAVVLGPVEAMLISAASMLADLRPGVGVDRPFLRWGVYTASRSITGALTGVAAALALGGVENRIGAMIFATAVGASVATGLDVVFVSLTVRIRGRGRLLDGARALGPVVLSSVPLYTPIVAILAYAYSDVSAWSLFLFVVPAIAAQRLFFLYQKQRSLTDDVTVAKERLEGANLSFASALVATLDARDRYTAGHSASVARFARDIATRIGLSSEEQELAYLAGLVHDIGKVGLPAGLLEKEGPLSLDERRQMQEHSAIGQRILENVQDYSEIARIVRHHHERVDGMGYPDGLHGDEIPLISRILTVADAYDAMTSDRPYREAMPSRVARLRLAQAVESQFDTSVVAAFEAILARADESYRQGTRTRGHRVEMPLVAAASGLV
jgi:putative nucleotidyltransferase with HDIG domain